MSEPKRNRSKQKKKRLLLQVGLIVVSVFLAIMLSIGTLVYRGSKEVYLRAKNEMIDRDLMNIRKNILKTSNLEWMLDYCSAHPEEMEEALSSENPLSEEESLLVYELYQKYGIMDIENGTNNKKLTEELDKAPEKLRFAVAKSIYQVMLLSFYLAQYQSHYEKLYCIDVSKEHYGFVYCSVDANNGEEFDFGEVWNYPVEDHPAVKTLTTGVPGVDFGDTVYELAKIESVDMQYYIGYTPIVIDGKVRCVVAISFDWSAFRDAMMPYIFWMFVVGIGIIVIFCAVLLVFLHRSAVRPLRKIQRGVRDYMDDKNSGAVADAMSRIRSKNEFGVLSDDIAELAQEIDRYTEENIRLASEQEKVAAELELAARIQSDMLPKQIPDKPQFCLHASMTPAKEVGGDFYDFFMIDGDHLGVVIADVSGKGIPASLYMMMATILIRNYARGGNSPSEVLRKSNRSICENSGDKMFVTVWFGIIELSSGHVIAANAGHEYPLIRRQNGPFELFKDPHNFVIGALPGMKYKEYEFDLKTGDTLFLYTDGAAEATDANEQMFGTERMLDVLNRDPDAAPEGLIANMTAAINAFCGDAPQFDDLTMLCIRYNGGDDAALTE